jgi:hypothetical protein
MQVLAKAQNNSGKQSASAKDSKTGNDHSFSEDKKPDRDISKDPLREILRSGYNLSKIPVYSLAVQPRLKVNRRNDVFEKEADLIANQVIQAPEPAGMRNCDCGGKCANCVEEMAVQKARQSESKNGEDGVLIHAHGAGMVHEVLKTAGQVLDPETRAFMEPRLGHDFSQVRIHTGAAASQSAGAIDAKAYTVGKDIAFGQGQFNPKSKEGLSLLAHELVHTLQSGMGAGNGLIHRRRVPSSSALSDDLPAASPGFEDVREGVALDLSRAWGELSATQQAAVRTAVSGIGFTWTTEPDLHTQLSTANRTQLLNFADAIRATEPNAVLGNPVDTNLAPRNAAEKANTDKLVAGTDPIFAEIAGTGRDTDLGQVFGSTTNVSKAKAKYHKAQVRLGELKALNKIVADRSGFNDEAHVGGESNSAEISLKGSVIDTPTDKESIVTLIHESLHAGNTDVVDKGYTIDPLFTKLPEDVKLTNAAHFEVVPARILHARSEFAGVTFVPAGTTSGGVTSAPSTPKEVAIRNASEVYRQAWEASLDLHGLFLQLFRHPTQWATLDLHANFAGAPAGSRFKTTLPFWSKVEMLTMHNRLSSIKPTGTAADRPVTQLDLALAEGVSRKLGAGIGSIPKTEADALALENASATPAEKGTIGTAVFAERDLLIRLILRTKLGSITGTESRDERVILRLSIADRPGDFSDFLTVRRPSLFP